jgi:REP element-mobilizing transposase RayT
MSRLLIDRYYAGLADLKRYGGSVNETTLRGEFQKLLDAYCAAKNYRLVPELWMKSRFGNDIRFDGVVKDALRFDLGYWEAKDEKDNLDREIEAKFAKGYPDDNILFEDTRTAVLFQNAQEVCRIGLEDAIALDGCLTAFLDYERPEVRGFRQAVEKFREDLPQIVEVLRETIAAQELNNSTFLELRDRFWETCKTSINPQITLFDVQEILIQHILSEDIFLNVFNDAQFHRDNNIAQQVQAVVNTFFSGSLRRNVLKSIDHYYGVIRQQSAAIADHHEKQEFLKSVYENFYKAYNPKAADRLGIVYTPSEIVRFMIQGTDFLLDKHFDRLLSDEGVKVLDPATGTGTFITELIEYLPARSLAYKYQHDLFCNEVAILPYYIANLNIEYCYQQKMKAYEEFRNICFLDTLDHGGLKEEQKDLFAISIENTGRIRHQNAQDLTVIIGNPPYNAWQENFNLRNPNRPYKEIDKRVKDSYIKKGKAQNKIAVYDMYVRFYRWAVDRIGTQGVIAFVTNRSFINSRAFDGFRKCFAEEFDFIYLIDLGGDVRENPKLSGTMHNVFGIQAGVAIAFCVKLDSSSGAGARGLSPLSGEGCRIFYIDQPEMATAKEKLCFLAESSLQLLAKSEMARIKPDAKQNWINLTDNDFDSLLPLIDKEVKAGRGDGRAIFRLFSRGVATQRDEWVYDFSRDNLEQKVKYMIAAYQERLKTGERRESLDIKWDYETESYLVRGIEKKYNQGSIRNSMYRPYLKLWLYFDKHFNGRTYQLPDIFRGQEEYEKAIWIKCGSAIPFYSLAINCIPDLMPAGGSQCFPIFTYDRDGKRSENITDWALQQFRAYYQPSQTRGLSPLPQPETQAENSHPQNHSQPSQTRGLSPLPQPETQAENSHPQNHSQPSQTRGLSPLPQPDGQPSQTRGLNPLPHHWLVTFVTHNSRVSERMVVYGVERNDPIILDAADRILIAQNIVEATERYNLAIRTFNVLPDHVHVVIGAESEKSLNESIRKLKGYTSSAFKKARNLETGYGIWAQKFNRENLPTEIDIDRAIEYVINNAYKHSERWGDELIEAWEKGNNYDLPPMQNVVEELHQLHQTRGLSPLPQTVSTRGLSSLSQSNQIRQIEKIDIFHYVYAVLHHPAYRQKYEINLKRDFPRLPLYDNFWQWATWGRDLMEMHIHYETIDPHPLQRTDLPNDDRPNPPKLKANKTDGTIQIDRLTTLSGIPAIAWDYKLGNRSAIEWVLDQHKEKKPKDPTIRELFNTYRFADHKETAIALIQRLCTVSIRTMDIIHQMPPDSIHQPRRD